MFEGYGPLGVPLMVEVETDNKNRVLGEVRLIFKKTVGHWVKVDQWHLCLIEGARSKQRLKVELKKKRSWN